eukprot:c11913_g1_i1.p1 GENE.c11913_g1_i1~~c11913_g1_i1.p1  ORF type:complete len:271 (-),score=87.87 c11913_g1_i1:39-851(-)
MGGSESRPSTSASPPQQVFYTDPSSYPGYGAHSRAIPNQLQPVIPATETLGLQNVVFDVRANKNSVVANKGKSDNHLSISFFFDTEVLVTVEVYYIATVTESGQTISKLSSSLPVCSVTVQPGKNQQFTVPEEFELDLSQVDEKKLFHTQSSQTYPLIIQLTASSPNANVNCHRVFLTFVKDSKVGYGCKCLEQQVQVGDRILELKEIYGLNTGKHDGCVVCLEKEPDTMILPCRHLCLCKDCGDLYKVQNKNCPYCRKMIVQLILLEKQ